MKTLAQLREEQIKLFGPPPPDPVPKGTLPYIPTPPPMQGLPLPPPPPEPTLAGRLRKLRDRLVGCSTNDLIELAEITAAVEELEQDCNWWED